jgi:hypothetical protein
MRDGRHGEIGFGDILVLVQPEFVVWIAMVVH